MPLYIISAIQFLEKEPLITSNPIESITLYVLSTQASKAAILKGELTILQIN